MVEGLTSLANRCYPARGLLALIGIVAVAGGSALAAHASRSAQAPAAALAVAVFVVTWNLFLACIWFHPVRGFLWSEARLGTPILTPRRAATFLILFTFCGLLLIPVILLI